MEKIPTERTIYDYTIKQMKALKVHDVAYNRIVGIYAGMLRQYYILVKDWEKNGCPATVESAAGSLKKHPSLDQIEKLRKDIEAYAKELIGIQAKREASNGFKFSPDTVWQEEFEEGFPYEETKDQMKAIQDVKNDMESYKIMDRIVCGDVGYGKTEVALRAAFKATMNQKQVVLLAPTTVLAQQHYERFIERFKNFPLNIKLLSRLESPKIQKEIIEEIKIMKK